MSINLTTERQTPASRPGVIFIGRRCRLSEVPLRAMLERGLDVRAVVVPATPVSGHASSPIARVVPRRSRSLLPMAGRERAQSLDATALRYDVPMFEVSALDHPGTVAALAGLRPDFAAVSCFPYRLPPALLRLPRLAALNLHPSLLPRHRGPDPLFWVYRHDDAESGVTIHQMTDRLDAGDIVEQATLEVSRGIPGDVLEVHCAEAGGALLCAAIDKLWRGDAELRPQAEEEATYETWPDDEDLRLDLTWPAERAYHFTRGVMPLGYRPYVEVGSRRLIVRDVTGYDAAAGLDDAVVVENGVATIRFTPGVLRVVLSE